MLYILREVFYMKKILVVLTNVDQYATKDEPTGLWLSEATHFIEEFDHNDNVQIDLVSPKGGNVPLDPKSLGDSLDESTKAYFENETFMNQLKNTLKPSEVNASDYDAIYFTGGTVRCGISRTMPNFKSFLVKSMKKAALYPACATGLQPC